MSGLAFFGEKIRAGKAGKGLVKQGPDRSERIIEVIKFYRNHRSFLPEPTIEKNIKKKQKNPCNTYIFCYNTDVDVAKMCEVAETPEGVVMYSLISGNSHGASLLTK